MAKLSSKTISAGVDDILCVESGIHASTGRNVKDGDDNLSPLWLTTTKLGIGATPTAPLHVSSTSPTGLLIERTGSTENVAIGFKNTEGSPTNWFIGKAEDGGFGISDGSEDLNSATNRLYISSAGNVGIGTASPQGLLDVKDGDIVLTRSEQAITTDTDLGSIKWYADDNSASEALELSAQIQYIGTTTWNESASEANLNFMLKATADVLPTTKMTIAHDGNVGIGTSTPRVALELGTFGGAPFAGNLAVGSDANHVAIVLCEVSGGTEQYGIGVSTGGDLQFHDSAAGTISMTLQDTTGNVGIGTDTPTTLLDVAGSMAFTTASGADRQISYKDTRDTYGMSKIHFYDSSGAEGIGIFTGAGGDGSAYTLKFKVDVTGDTYTNDGDTNSLSDIRVKKDIADLSDGLSIVNQLKPKTYKFNGKGEMGDDDGIVRYGFVADEVLAVASQYVTVKPGKIDGVEVDDLKSMSHTRFIPMLVKAIQELSAKVTALENA